MSINGRNQRYVFKIPSSHLRRENWDISLKINDARKNGELVSIGESQLLRWIDELNGIQNCEDKLTEIKNNLEYYRKQAKSDSSLQPVLKSLYQQLDHYQFKPDYVCVVIDKVSDYKKMYKKGFNVNGIHFRRLLGTPNGVKQNTIVFVNEKLYTELQKRITNGRNLTKEFVPAKLEAYQALVCSSSVPVSMPKGIVCVPDAYTYFKEDVIELDDSEDGEPKMTYVKDKECELCDSDGYGLGMPSLLKRWGEDIGEDYILPGCVIRNSFCKGTVYPVDFKKFALEHRCTKIIDSWGFEHDVNDVELILTESMLKLWDSYSSIDDYLEKCNKNHYSFAITKAAENKLENVRNMNYQFLQSYRLSENDITDLISPTVSEIKDVISNDWRKTICYAKGVGLNEHNISKNIFGDFATALMIEPKLLGDSYVQNQLKAMIHKRIQDAKIGVLEVEGCYALVCGDPYSLCQSIFGLEITGLLKAGEIYSKYWIDKGVEEIVMYRAPMLDMNNVRKVKVVHNKKMDDFYKYITTPILLNSWDMITDAMSGMDKDGDCVISTNNNVLLKRTLNLPPIHCLQRKAEKKIPLEDDIFESNIKSFGNAVGSVTNKSTAMFEVRARFPKDSKEWDILSYRIKCIQQSQQNEIDKTKGIVAKSMPKYWYDWFATKPEDGDTDDIIEWKKFQRTIVADKKPYFFQYIYPAERSKWMKYEKNTNTKCIMQFGMTLDELKKTESLNKEQQDFLMNYAKRTPLGMAGCTINRICWRIEREFANENMRKVELFDYNLLKSPNANYSRNAYSSILNIYKEYLADRRKLDSIIHSQKTDDFDRNSMRALLINHFKKKCTVICPDKEKLCNILIDICYKDSNNSKRFVWDICGDVIIDNLLNRANGIINYPAQDENGDFEYCGIRFSMQKYNLIDQKLIN